MPAFCAGSLHNSRNCATFVAHRGPVQRHADPCSVFPQTLLIFAAIADSVFGRPQELFASGYLADWQQHLDRLPGDFGLRISIEPLCSTAPGLDDSIE